MVCCHINKEMDVLTEQRYAVKCWVKLKKALLKETFQIQIVSGTEM